MAKKLYRETGEIRAIQNYIEVGMYKYATRRIEGFNYHRSKTGGMTIS